MRKKWDRETLSVEARRYDRRVDFMRSRPGAYAAAIKRHPDLLDEIFGEYFTWKEEDVRRELSKYTSKGELQQKDGSMYSITLRRFPHLLKEYFDPVRFTWNEESIRDAINLVSSRTEFHQLFPGASMAASKRFPHLLNELPQALIEGTDNDTVYIWRVLGMELDGIPIYKIGITSSRLGNKRISQVAKNKGLDYEIICCEKVSISAMKIESKLLLLGEPVELGNFNGGTEFRALNDSALYVAITLISESI